MSADKYPSIFSRQMEAIVPKRLWRGVRFLCAGDARRKRYNSGVVGRINGGEKLRRALDLQRGTSF